MLLALISNYIWLEQTRFPANNKIFFRISHFFLQNVFSENNAQFRATEKAKCAEFRRKSVKKIHINLFSEKKCEIFPKFCKNRYVKIFGTKIFAINDKFSRNDLPISLETLTQNIPDRRRQYFQNCFHLFFNLYNLMKEFKFSTVKYQHQVIKKKFEESVTLLVINHY